MFSICIDGIFKSIQGEGKQVGKSAVFIRFSGCNKEPRCSFCDEEFEKYKRYGINEILDEVERLEPFSMIILTGGEPTIQNKLELLVEAFHKRKYFVAIETNGMLPIPEKIDWITCSPKKDTVNALIKEVDEFKFIIDDTPEDELNRKIKNIISRVKCKHIYLQPMSNKKEFIEKAIKMIECNDKYRLSVQVHKFIDVR